MTDILSRKELEEGCYVYDNASSLGELMSLALGGDQPDGSPYTHTITVRREDLSWRRRLWNLLRYRRTYAPFWWEVYECRGLTYVRLRRGRKTGAR